MHEILPRQRLGNPEHAKKYRSVDDAVYRPEKVPPILDGEDDGDARKELGEEPSDAVHEAGSDEVEDRVYGEVEPYRPVLFKDLGVEVPKSKNEEEQDEQQPAEN